MGGGQKQAEQPEEEDATALFRLSPLGSAGLSRAVCPQWGCRRLTATAAAQARSKSTMPAMRSTLAKVTRQRVSGRARDWKFAGDDDGQAEAAKQQVKQLREQRKRAMAEKDPRLQRDIAAGQPRRLALQKYTQLRSCRRPATRRTSPPERRSGLSSRAAGEDVDLPRRPKPRRWAKPSCDAGTLLTARWSTTSPHASGISSRGQQTPSHNCSSSCSSKPRP